MIEQLQQQAISLLKQLIAAPSFSKEEEHTAEHIKMFFEANNISYEVLGFNVFAKNKYFDESKPTILLNSHHDTVKPNKGYSRDPFKPTIENGLLYGLGSNDAGGCLVSLLATFAYFYEQENLAYNIVMLASAEEENSGDGGIRSVMPVLPPIDFAIIGEPTQMQLAIAEKGLLVLDCYGHGRAGHAAHQLGDNAIYKAMKAIDWFANYQFEKTSKTLGDVKMTVTQVDAGKQHNVIPATCHFVVDIRVTDAYTNLEVLNTVKQSVDVEVKERSLKLNSSSISADHPIVKSGLSLGRTTYGSPTLSDQSNLSCPSLKLGPGDSHRSHMADEYIGIEEINEGITLYIKILENIL